MAKKENSTKGRIVSAAWELFYEQGYDNTTVDEIVKRSNTSKGSFYHYFDGKDALLSSLSYLFDEMYEKLQSSFSNEMSARDKLVFLNREAFMMIENRISVDLLSRLLSTQLITRGERHLLDKNRTYYKLLRSIILEGQQKGELTESVSANDIVKAYALYERAVMYDWCICAGDYSLCRYSGELIGRFLDGFCKIQ
ncbi:MAG: TetR/AcrR family transcriptional regulator [Ruminococcaceae bacterium]|nr:TetR/AcrR family transcriptional regulator [Oscillospiraceae bacterium]